MADMGTKEAAEKWGVTQRTVQNWCRTKKITPQPTQDAPGSSWHIEKDAIPPMRKK
ncbi:MAG: helix-turn-helix domain-containing protein [Clostridia bacterium]|nr:helix-turn-helix domain-containing protein [Clostridia bacterium]